MREGDVRRGAVGADLGPDDARGLLHAWLEAIDLRLGERELLALLQHEDFSHADLFRRARRAHERKLAVAVDGVLSATTTGGDLGAAAAGLFDACVAAIPYAPAAAFLGREKGKLVQREGDPLRVALVADAVGGMHGVTHTLDEIRERGVPGFEVEVVGTDPNVDRRLSAVAEVDIPFYAGLKVGVPSLPAIVEALAEGRYDLVHLCSPGPAGVAAAVIARVMEVPVLGSYHTELAAYAGLRAADPQLEFIARAAIAAFYGQCQVVLCPSPASDDVLRGMGIDAERIGRWDRGVDVARFSPARRDAAALPGELSVLYAGRLTREKGADLLADAFLAARERDPRLHLVPRRRRPRGGRAARAPRRARDLPRLARGRRARRRLRERRPLPLRQPHRHLRAGPARGAGQRAAGRRGRRGRPVLDRRGRRHRAPAARPTRRRWPTRSSSSRPRRCSASAWRRRRSRRCASAPGSAPWGGWPTATAGRWASDRPPGRGVPRSSLRLVDGTAAQARHGLALGAPAGDRRQPAQDELEVGHHEAADGQEGLGHPAGAMRREQQSLDRAGRVVGRDRLARPHVDGSAQAPGGGEHDERVEVDHRGAAHDEHRSAVRQELELAPAEHRLVVGRGRGEDEDHPRGAQQLVQAAGLGARRRGWPGRAATGRGRARDSGRARAVARARGPRSPSPTTPTSLPASRKRVAVGDVEVVGLGAGAHGAVGRGDAAREVDGHAERRLGHGGREGGAGHEDVDAAREARLVVDVAQEVALDVDHRPQPRRAGDALGVEVGLPDDGDGVGEVGLDHRVGHPARAFMHDDVAERVEPGARRGVEHRVHRARLGVDQDRRHLRIVDVALFYGERSGGIRTYLDAKVRHARATGAFEHHVVVPGPRERHRNGRHELPSLRLAAANGYRVPLGVRALKRTLERLRPDVVFLHDPFWAPLKVTEAAHALGPRWWPSTTGRPRSTPPACAGRCARGRRSSAPGCATPTRRSTRSPRSSTPSPTAGAQASFPLRLGLHDAFRPQTGVARGDHVLYVGRLAREKGVFRLLEAAARSDDPWPLRLIGSGPAEDALRRRARALGIARRVAFQPFVSDRGRLARAYAGARCVVMPGEHETFGLVALEAAASGARVVACASAPSAEILGDLAHRFAPGDTDGLAAAIALARAARTDPATAAALCWRLCWDRLFAEELDDLHELAA